MSAPTCSTPDCPGKVVAKGLCRKCWQRQHYATHSEAYRRKLESNIKWHWENIEAIRDYARKKATAKKVRELEASRYRNRTGLIELHKEVARHLAKGRGLADICIFTNQKMSVIQSVIDALKSAQPANTP